MCQSWFLDNLSLNIFIIRYLRIVTDRGRISWAECKVCPGNTPVLSIWAANISIKKELLVGVSVLQEIPFCHISRRDTKIPEEVSRLSGISVFQGFEIRKVRRRGRAIDLGDPALGVLSVPF